MNIASLHADPQYAALKNHVLAHTGLGYYIDKDEDFATRLLRRVSARAVKDCGSYLRMLTDPVEGGPEMDCLVGELTVGETYFFRQREHFDLLRSTIIPDLIRRNQHSRRLRIWSAGCATGAEPYSIAILLQLDFRSQLEGWDVSILGSDINVDFLAQAKEGAFALWALRSSTEDFRRRCFTDEGKSWKICPEFQRSVTFQYYNLASEADLPHSAEAFDLVVCRNVLIYFSRERTMSVLERFRRALTPGGWLLVGYAEPNIDMFRAFETVSLPEVTVYRKRDQNVGDFAPATEIPSSTPPWMPMELPPPPVVSRPIEDQPARQSGGPNPPTIDDVRMLADCGRWEAATALADKLIESDSLDPAIHFTSALIHEHLGAIQEATSALRRAIYLDRQFALAHYHLGTLLQRGRETEPANRCFRNAMAILNTMPEDEPIPHGDSITAGELRSLAATHLEISRQ